MPNVLTTGNRATIANWILDEVKQSSDQKCALKMYTTS